MNIALPEITPEFVLKMYTQGIFPMADSGDSGELFWLDPEERVVIPLDAFHIPRRLRKTIRKQPFHVTADNAFYEIMEACAEPAEGRDSTWINNEIFDLYTGLYEIGHAHSIECWQEGELVGGLYGVSLGAAFFGESMFSKSTDASKIALCYLVAALVSGGFILLDAQFMNEHLRQFGTIEVPRRIYKEHLNVVLSHNAFFHSSIVESLSPEAVVSIGKPRSSNSGLS